MHLPLNDEIYGCDVFIACKGESIEMNDEFTNFERDTLTIINEIKPIKTIIIHIEESDQLGYDDYLKIENNLTGLQFAYDGMIIEV